MNYNYLNVKRVQNGIEWNQDTPKEILQYAVGGLLYTPANHKTIAKSICEKRYCYLKNIVFCLEDSILDEQVASAEIELLASLGNIQRAVAEKTLSKEELPLIFIRVRSAKQMNDLYEKLEECESIVTGFVFPKFDRSCMEEYCVSIQEMNKTAQSKKYMMPILESGSIMRHKTRQIELLTMEKELRSMADFVLNIRVGGNDFCNLFALRRGVTDTIYDISLVRDVLTDILNVFAEEYVVSAPVWEYFGDVLDLTWKEGLERELRLDLLNGFVGKTAIHPVQLPVIQEAYMVEEKEYESAKAVLQWDKTQTAVSKSTFINRMDEKKVHERWAKKILALGQIYGVKESNL